MAVLKDLIVHGSSRFLNKIYANQIQAESGIFNKLIAKDATMENATVVGLLDVQGQLHTNAWTNSNIATIDGSFYITPTISSAEGTASNISATTIQFVPRNNTFAVVSSLYYYDTSAHEGTWLKYSRVLVTGQVQLNGEWIPLGTILGYLNADGTANSLVIAGAEDNKHRASPVLAQLVANGVTTSTSLNYRNLKVSLYQRSSSSSNNADAYKYPLGIFMTAMGTNGKTFLDIYGGGNVLTTTYGGYADPNVRIGNLSGLPAVGNQTPVGWGIYTTNGYFKGVVAADLGKIGGWTIASDGLYYGGSSTAPGANNVLLSPGKSSSTAIGGSSGTLTWAITAGTTFGVTTGGAIYATSGKIGGFDIGTSVIKNTKTSYSETTNNGVWLGTDGIGLGKGTFYVTNAGAMTAKSGTIAGWRIESSYLASGSATGPAANALILSPSGTSSSYTVAGQAKTGWMITAGTTFGVNKDGGIYATSGNIAGWSFDTNSFKTGTWGTDNSAIICTGTGTAKSIGGSESISGWVFAAGANFGVTKTGDLYAQNAHIVGEITANSGSIASGVTIGGKNQSQYLNSNIQIGGTNLLKNSNDLTKWSKESGLTVTWDSTVNMYKVVDTSHTSSKWGIYQDLDIKPSTTYTFSIWGMKSEDTSTTSAIGTFASSLSWPSTNGSTYTTTMSRSSVTFTSGADHLKCRVYLYLNPTADNSRTGYFYRPKLEEGNKTTDWSPAPEDIDVHNYITDIDSNKGITIKPADASGNDYLQINSSAINFYRNNVETLKIEDSAIRVGKLGNNLRNVYITDSAVQIRNNTSVLAEYGSSIKLYQPTTTTVAVEISSTGATFTGNVKATSLSTGTKTAATTGKGTFINSDGAIYVGNGSTNNFTVTDTGTITATGANLLTATIGNATNKITIGTGTSGHSSVRYGLTTLSDTSHDGFYIGTDGIALGKGVFKVTNTGTITATDAHITGEITATSGSIASSVTIGTGGVSLSTIQSNASNGKEAYDLQYSSDTRNKNENPQYYITNYPRKQVNEFKSASTIGLTTGNGYCTLTTIVPWGDSSGGYPKQEANFNGKRYWRQGTSATAWSAWVDASAVATSYIVADSTGLMIADMSGGTATSSTVSSQNVFIDSNSVNIRNGQDVLAKFGTTTQIGKNGKTRVEVDYHSLKLIDLDDETYFHLSDLRDEDGYLAIEDRFIADGHTQIFNLSYPSASPSYDVTVSDSSGGTTHTAIMNFYFDTAPTEDAIITATYYTISPDAKAITFGTRSSGIVGGMSAAIGIENIASNKCAMAIGMRNSATQEGSVAIGKNCKAMGQQAFAIGYETEATHHAVAQNQGTKASSLWQTAMGSYNIEDKAGKYALIIGNGDADIRRSNAYAVTFDGDEHLALDTAATTGTIDGNLYTAITALGWGNEVIV